MEQYSWGQENQKARFHKEMWWTGPKASITCTGQQIVKSMNVADLRLNNYFKDLRIFTMQECSYIKKQKNTLSQSLEYTLNPKRSQDSTNYYFVYSLLSEDNLHMKKQDFSQPEKHTCKP
jgi:hypothetical protein